MEQEYPHNVKDLVSLETTNKQRSRDGYIVQFKTTTSSTIIFAIGDE